MPDNVVDIRIGLRGLEQTTSGLEKVSGGIERVGSAAARAAESGLSALNKEQEEGQSLAALLTVAGCLGSAFVEMGFDYSALDARHAQLRPGPHATHP